MNHFRLFDTVELLRALDVEEGFNDPGPAHLEAGQRGKVVEVFDAEHALVEFPNSDGEAIAIEVVTPDQVRVITRYGLSA